MIELKNVNKRFRKKEVLHDISYTFGEGVYGLLGPNGAGKTTLMRCMTELYNYQGEILYDGARATANCLRHMGYLPQKFGALRELTAREMLLYFANVKKLPKAEAERGAEECLEIVGLTDRAGSKVRALSGGMVRRLGIAQALLGNPQTLIFDEPTAGLDPEERMRFKSIISRQKEHRTILISTHIVGDLEAVSDQILLMNQGELLSSSTREELAAAAKGKVYECTAKELGGWRGTYAIQSEFDREGEPMVRLLTGEETPFTPCAPSVEDGYLCLLKKI